VTETELPSEMAMKQSSDAAPKRLLEVAPVRRSVEAAMAAADLGVKAGEAGR
jgi:hypothetical protein